MTRARTIEPQTRAVRIGLLAGLGYVGAGIVTVGGLAMILDSSVDLGTRVLAGALIMIAMRPTIRPAPGAPAAKARHSAREHRP